MQTAGTVNEMKHEERSTAPLTRRGASGRVLRRRSLLKGERTEEAAREHPLARMILISYLAAVLFYGLWVAIEPLFGPVATDPIERLRGGFLPIGLFVLPIILLAHFALRTYERRRPEGKGDVVVRTGIWIGAGLLGSIIGYEALVMIRVGLPNVDAGFLTTAFTVNFAAVLLASVAGTAVSTRRKGRMLQSQQKLLTDEFRAAYRMQQTLLPDGEAGLYGFDISAAMQPAVEVGGDYYDYLTFADGSKGILVADASGKGLPAALMMAKFQGMAQALSAYIADPSEFFIGLNDTLRVRLDRQSFVTVGMVTIDFDDRCSFWRAGHNELLHYHAATGEVSLRRPPGLALGLTHGGHLGSKMVPETFTMGDGDVLLLFSDGLSEACNEFGEEFGENLLPITFRSLCLEGRVSRTIRDELLKELGAFVGDQEGQDDVTVVVIRKRSDHDERN